MKHSFSAYAGLCLALTACAASAPEAFTNSSSFGVEAPENHYAACEAFNYLGAPFDQEFGVDLMHTAFYAGASGSAFYPRGVITTQNATRGFDLVFDFFHRELIATTFTGAGTSRSIGLPGLGVAAQAHAGLAVGLEGGVSNWLGFFHDVGVGGPLAKISSHMPLSFSTSRFIGAVDHNGDGHIDTDSELLYPPNGVYGGELGVSVQLDFIDLLATTLSGGVSRAAQTAVGAYDSAKKVGVPGSVSGGTPYWIHNNQLTHQIHQKLLKLGFDVRFVAAMEDPIDLSHPCACPDSGEGGDCQSTPFGQPVDRVCKVVLMPDNAEAERRFREAGARFGRALCGLVGCRPNTANPLGLPFARLGGAIGLLRDEGHHSLATACERAFPEPEECTDGVDNDADGATDCFDEDCKHQAQCMCGAEGGTTYLKRGINEGQAALHSAEDIGAVGDVCIPECTPTSCDRVSGYQCSGALGMGCVPTPNAVESLWCNTDADCGGGVCIQHQDVTSGEPLPIMFCSPGSYRP